ncbi:SGNH/GDSL hydrolase family protein [Roseateles cellulosilyticus]|uniref:SGNH/GDSL hydrolase family protein n=1 Tax=Pelomonas cellulosilytica TaxID=2906762 RepID=A0ABS8XN67_9BURK|nr:SGNH/GDSL hydrolase family protein [Pelomonas sp. P8]MCE4553087.1 SGNH/GDSL hydrolase family protein [Pelomonas sp. P8]
MHRFPAKRFSGRALGLITAVLLAACGVAPRAPAPTEWKAAWGSAQLPQPPIAAANVPAPLQQPLRDVSLRQVVRTTVAGDTLRVRVSNLFGREPLQLDVASVALVQPGTETGRPALQAGSLRPLSFQGRRELTIAPGAEAWSDPVSLALPRLADVAVQMHVVAAPSVATVHPGSRISSWAWAGNHADMTDWPDAIAKDGWWHLAAIDVAGGAPAQPVLVAIGDSITDGYGVQSGSYLRWTDALARRLGAPGRTSAVINTGIGGNRILHDGLGPSLVSRFERDALAQSGVTHIVLLEGVNDLGSSHRQRATTPESRAALLAELQQALGTLAGQARQRGVCLFVATVMPYGGSGYYQPQPENEADRQALNAWIRQPGRFDAVLDFDAITRDPAKPSHLRRDLDNDGLHPSTTGYQAMADAFPLEWLDRRCAVR